MGSTFIYYKRKHLDDSDLVGNIQSVVVGGQTHVGLLLPVGTDQGVDLGHVDVVQLLDCSLNLVLVGLKKRKRKLSHFYFPIMPQTKNS